MFGRQSLFAIDIAIKTYAMISSIVCLFTYTCANAASCDQLSEFNTQLKNKIDDKSILVTLNIHYILLWRGFFRNSKSFKFWKPN